MAACRQRRADGALPAQIPDPPIPQAGSDLRHPRVQPVLHRHGGRGENHFRSHVTWADFNMATGAVHTMTGMDAAEHLSPAQAASPCLFAPAHRGAKASSPCSRIIAEQIRLLATGMPPGPYLDDLICFLDTRFINPPSSYNYVVEGDIKGCLDPCSHYTLPSEAPAKSAI